MVERNEILKMPNSIRREEFKIILFGFFMTLLFDASAFLLQFSKDAISSGKIILGVFLFILNYAKEPFSTWEKITNSNLKNELSEKRDIVLTEKAANVLFKCRNQVNHRNEQYGYSEKMSSGKIISYVKEYLQLLWEKELFVYKYIGKVTSALIVLVGLAKTIFAEVEEVAFFSVLLLISIVVKYFSTTKKNVYRTNSENALSENHILKSDLENSIYQSTPINSKHCKYLLSTYIELANKSVKIWYERWIKADKVDLIEHTIQAIIICFFLVMSVVKVGIENVDALTILGVISVLEIYQRFMENLKLIFEISAEYKVTVEKINKKAEICDNIFDVFESKTKKVKSLAQGVKSLEILPFYVGYSLDVDGANKSFHLSSKKSIVMNNGDFVLLSGPSNSGKSTLMNIITGNLVFDNITINLDALNNGELNSVLQQDMMQLGTVSVLEEITLGKTEYDREKLLEILNAMHLTEELVSDQEDIFEYLSNTSIDRFSEGQIQRLTIARTLFNVGEEVHIVAFDEATNKLNSEIAFQVAKYIKCKYLNVIVIFSTHQVDTLKELATKHLVFEKIEDAVSSVEKVGRED